VSVGVAAEGQLAYRTAVALAERLDTKAREFPGGHDGFVSAPAAFGAVLRQVLAEA
jgi:hypothetical protein